MASRRLAGLLDRVVSFTGFFPAAPSLISRGHSSLPRPRHADTSITWSRRLCSSAAHDNSHRLRTLRDLDVEGVYQFALQQNLDTEDAVVLKKQKVDGSQLLKVTQATLERWGMAGWGMAGGAVGRLLDALQLLQPIPFGDKLKSIAKTRLDRDQRSLDDVGWEFVNREEALGRVAALNIWNNFQRSKRRVELQRITLPVAMHSFGAGKSELARHYVNQLKKDGVREATKRALEKMKEDDPIIGLGVVEFGTRQLTSFVESSPLVVGIVYEDGMPVKHYFRALYEELKEILEEDPRAVPDDYRYACRHLLIRILSHVPVFLYIDEIGCVQNFDDYRLLRGWFGSFYHGLKENLGKFPLHLYFCGRFAHDLQGDMSSRAYSRVSHELILLQPFTAGHVASLHQSMTLYSGKFSAMVYERIAEVTGGIPRLIRMLLGCMSSAGDPTEEAVVFYARLIGTSTRYNMEFVRLDRGHLLEFASCIAAEELDICVPKEGSALFWTHQVVRILPVLAARQESGSYSLKCCPIWAYRLRDDLKALNYEGALGTAMFLPAPQTPGESREFDVLRYLGERMLPYVAAARIPSEMPSIPGTPVHVDLSHSLSFLFGADSTGAYPVLEALGVQPDVRPQPFASVPTYFSPRLNRLKKVYKSKVSGVTLGTFWQHLEAVAKNDPRPDAAAFYVAAAQSHSPDIFLRLPPGREMPLNLISFQIKGRQADRSNAVPLSVSLDDCIVKIPQDVPGRQLHVLLADEVTRQFESFLQAQPLVLQGVYDAAEARVVSPVSKRDNSVLNNFARALPAGAVLMVLNPRDFKQLMPRLAS